MPLVIGIAVTALYSNTAFSGDFLSVPSYQLREPVQKSSPEEPVFRLSDPEPETIWTLDLPSLNEEEIGTVQNHLSSESTPRIQGFGRDVKIDTESNVVELIWKASDFGGSGF